MVSSYPLGGLCQNHLFLLSALVSDHHGTNIVADYQKAFQKYPIWVQNNKLEKKGGECGEEAQRVHCERKIKLLKTFGVQGSYA